ncbi:MAG: radical SAM protein [Candidatus Woesearchaeota archaeon]
MKILFAKAPRYQWAFHSSHSSFWPPLGFCSMAAVLRENLDVKVAVRDLPAAGIGWKHVAPILRHEKPDVLCLGEETASSHEALRLASLAKELNPEVKVIVGGCHFTFTAENTLLNNPVDFVVKHEGELTMLELSNFLLDGKDNFADIKGIAFRNGQRVVHTKPRPLLDMEKLPMPAFDLLDMDHYGSQSHSHRDFVAVEHSRGCSSSCNFCVLWKQMASINPKSGVPKPCYRTKSVKKTVDEIECLQQKFKRKTFCWVDPTWNADSHWNLEFCNEISKRKLDVDHAMWMRADYIVRDDNKGIFSKLVKAGTRQVMIGIERINPSDLVFLNKRSNDYSTVAKAFNIVAEYPQVLSIASYIYGLPDETPKSLKEFYHVLKDLPFDVGMPIPLTPLPGTKYFANNDLLEENDYRYYNFINPVMRSANMSRNWLLWRTFLSGLSSRGYREQFFRPDSTGKRRLNAINNLAASKRNITWKYFLNFVLQPFGKSVNYNIKPDWYDK